ncbi:DNA mismatch repair endonuclease MutL [Peptoniphilus catoniae]|uniref:DNA mismatch repair endonuclease MutL n=1 Tax=Peptoniphilus catoniae TaxID=1660341 RepID=UPI0010FE81EF|nr:DNA mismatch repair endonuclease MutL [Peptoniphilus catoniae]
MTINILDDNTISKIAAGEIIENPASIVKELLENSIDAQAKHILVQIQGECTHEIKIIDDGIGMIKEDLQIAFLRHSTSKLKNADDLMNISSLGFRGEALASISAVSKIEVLTKNDAEKTGLKAYVDQGLIRDIKNIAMQRGTSFYIRDIFYNTPVRRKYLKSDNVEFNNIYDIAQKIALSNPNISIKLIRNNKIILESLKNENNINHIYSILGRDIASQLIPIEFKSSSYDIKGFISNNNLYRSNRLHQYIYINGRYVKSLEISKAIEDKYYSLIPLKRFPVFVLYINIDPILVDVNIHPKKQEIKLSKDNNLTEILSNLVSEALYPNRLIYNPKKTENNQSLNKSNKNISIFDLFKDKKSLSDNQVSINHKYQNFDVKEPNFDTRESKVKESDIKYEINFNNSALTEKVSNNLLEDNNKKIDKDLLTARPVGIIFDTFIILEDKSRDTLFLIDQHAAHERVMYEKFKNQYDNSKVYSQILLKPEIIKLSPKEKNLIENNLDLFKRLGFEISDFGESEVLIRQYPILFGENIDKNFIYDLISSLESVSNPYQVDPYRIMKKACKAAVKAGDKLSLNEVDSLLKSLLECDNPYTCPHGRPTVIEIRKSNIEKMFLRE